MIERPWSKVTITYGFQASPSSASSLSVPFLPPLSRSTNTTVRDAGQRPLANPAIGCSMPWRCPPRIQRYGYRREDRGVAEAGIRADAGRQGAVQWNRQITQGLALGPTPGLPGAPAIASLFMAARFSLSQPAIQCDSRAVMDEANTGPIYGSPSKPEQSAMGMVQPAGTRRDCIHYRM
jgi:hypothetical protein